MKIKNQKIEPKNNQNIFCKVNESNKQNIQKGDQKREVKVKSRGKSHFGQDITKRVNEPSFQRYKFTVVAEENPIKLPYFLEKKTAFNSQTSPYEQSIINYIIQTHDENQFTNTFKKRLKVKKNPRRYVVQKIYKLFRAYRLRRKTFYLAIYYFDKYIRLTDEKDIKKYDIIADACLLISMKYEEIYPPLLNKWATGKQNIIIQQQSKILKILNFKLDSTTSQHYLQIYQGKNIYNSKQQKRLHQLILDLYVFTGYIYDDHPLKIVQQILDSFRSTSYMQKQTIYQQKDKKVKKIISQNMNIWNFLIQMDIYSRKRQQ